MAVPGAKLLRVIAGLSNLTSSRSCSKVRVVDRSLQLRELNVAIVVGATSSEGYF